MALSQQDEDKNPHSLDDSEARIALASMREAYLELMRDSLIGWLNEDPGLRWDGTDIDFKSMLREGGGDWPSTAPSMIGRKRMDNVRIECERVLNANVPGDFMETGVWRGGACIMMRSVLKSYQIFDRRVIVADSFEGLPPPIAAPDAGSKFHTYKNLAISLETVKSAFARYNLLDDQVVFVPGWFKDTLPSAPVQKLALLRLDGDMYESTMEALVNLYHKLSPGGSLIVDDYYAIEAQRRAIDEYRDSNNISESIVPIDQFGCYWIKQ